MLYISRITKYEKQIGLDKLVLNESKHAKRRKRQSCCEDYLSCDVANKKSKSDEINSELLQAEVGDKHKSSDETFFVGANLSVIDDAAELSRTEVLQDKDQIAQIPATKEEVLCMDAVTAGNKDFLTTMKMGLVSHDAASTCSDKGCDLDTALETCKNKCKIGVDSSDCSYISVSADGCGVPRYSNWDYDSIKLPNMAGVSAEVVLESPPEHLLPPGVKLSKSSYIIDIEHYRKSSRFKVTGDQGTALQVTTVQPNAKNWAEYKRLLRMESEDEGLASSPAAVLWVGDVTPLIKPWQATSTCK